MHNTGLGDYIMMSGAVRHHLSYYNEVHLVSVHNKHRNVKFLYRDEPRVVLLEEPDARSSKGGQKKANRLAKNYRREGHEAKVFFWSYMAHWPQQIDRSGLDSKKNHWCETFYRNLGVEYSSRYENFYIERDLKKEEKLYEKVVARHGKDYIFVVDHTKRQRRSMLVPDSSEIVNPGLWNVCDTLIFDWMTVIERAKAIHTVDTAYMHLIKQMRIKDRPKFFHRYPRPCPGSEGNYINDQWDNGWIDVVDRPTIGKININGKDYS